MSHGKDPNRVCGRQVYDVVGKALYGDLSDQKI